MLSGRLAASGRVLLGWDQVELAERAGIRRHTLADFEGDVRKPQARVRQAVLQVLEAQGIRFVVMADAFGVTIEGSPHNLRGSMEPIEASLRSSSVED